MRPLVHVAYFPGLLAVDGLTQRGEQGLFDSPIATAIAIDPKLNYHCR